MSAKCEACGGSGLETEPFPDGEDAFGFGCTHDILGICPECHGTGFGSGSAEIWFGPCPECGGTGKREEKS